MQPLRSDQERVPPAGLARGGEPPAAARTRRDAPCERDPEKRIGVSRSGARPPHDEINRFIDVHRDQSEAQATCRVLSATDCGSLTSRGYRAAKQRSAAARDIHDKVLVGEI